MACPLDHKVTLTGPDGNPVVYTFKNEAELKTWMDEGGFEMIKKELELRKKQAQEAGKVETEEEKPEAPKEEEKKERETTGVKKKVLLEERAERGLEDVVIEMKRSGGSIFDAAKNLVDENPVLPRTLAAEVAEKGRPLTPEEIANGQKMAEEWAKRKEQEDAAAEAKAALKASAKAKLIAGQPLTAEEADVLVL